MIGPQNAHTIKIIGAYRLLRRLGGGTFGTVYLAEHRQDASLVAIKVLRVQLTRPEDFRDFINEARMVRLQHPHIMPVLDFGLSREGIPYLVMEYASGGTLRERYPLGTTLAWPTLLSYTEQLALALHYAHGQHLIHRDVKPENMLLREDGTLLLSDFGIAKVVEQRSLASLPSALGTPAYMAPEQSRGKPCFASDQYALAVLLYEWITGRRPFQGSALAVIMQHRQDPPPALTNFVPDLPPVIERVVLKALAKEPGARFASVQEFAMAFGKATEMLSPARPERTMPPTQTAPTLRQESTSAVTRKPPVPQALSVKSAQVLASPELTRSPHASLQHHQPALITLVPPQPNWSVRRLLFFGLLACLIVLVSLGAFLTHAGLLHGGGIPKALVSPTIATYDTFVARNSIQYGFDAAHTGYNPYERQLSPLTVQHLKQAWTASVGTGVDNAPSFSPTVANGLVYIGSDNNKLYVLKADGCGQASCQPLWIGSTDASIASSPAVANGRVYVSTSDGKLYVFKATGCGQASCSPLWAGFTGDPIYFSSPAIANGIVYISTYNDKLDAFNAAGCGQFSCAPLWTGITGDIDNNNNVSSPAVSNGLVYIGASMLNAFNAAGCGQASCSPLWTGATNSLITSSPAVSNGFVYVGASNGYLDAFKATGCDQSSCQPQWAGFTGDTINFSAPAVANAVVYTNTFDGKFYAFKATGCGPSSCAPLWTGSTGDFIVSAPTIANGVVYIGTDKGKLNAFRTIGCGSPSCGPLWTASTGEAIHSAPVVANGVVYVSSGNIPTNSSVLYAFHL